MRLGWSVLASVLAAGALSACSPAPPPVGAVTYRGKLYDDPAQALALQRADSDRFVAAISQEGDPIRGTVLVVVPDLDRLRPLVAQRIKRSIYSPGVEALVESDYAARRSEADALIKSGVFQSGSVREQNDTSSPNAGGADFVVWFEVRTVNPDGSGQWFGRWRLRRAQTREEVAVNADAGVAEGTPRLQNWADRVRQAALHLGGLTVAGQSTTAQTVGAVDDSFASGSGIIVDRDGDVLTNAHVVTGCEAPRILDAANESHLAIVVARDTTNDLALLKAKTAHWPTAAVFSDGRDLRAGQNVVVAGYPYGRMLGSDMAVTTGSVMALSGPRGDSRLIETTAPVQPGNSGGPLLDDRGNVIGIVTARLVGDAVEILAGNAPQNVNFATKATVASIFLDEHGIPRTIPNARPGASTADTAAEARQFTVRVECPL
jgi:S1-C subfamily serine protease